MHRREVIEEGSASDSVFECKDRTAAVEISSARRKLDRAAWSCVKTLRVEAVVPFYQADECWEVVVLRYLVADVERADVERAGIDDFGGTNGKSFGSEEGHKKTETEEEMHCDCVFSKRLFR